MGWAHWSTTEVLSRLFDQLVPGSLLPVATVLPGTLPWCLLYEADSRRFIHVNSFSLHANPCRQGEVYPSFSEERTEAKLESHQRPGPSLEDRKRIAPLLFLAFLFL